MARFFISQHSNQSVEDRILSLSDHAVCYVVPEKLRESGLFSDWDIVQIVQWLIEYRATHHLDTID